MMKDGIFGALAYVLVNDPLQGYGVFENMILKQMVKI